MIDIELWEALAVMVLPFVFGYACGRVSGELSALIAALEAEKGGEL